MASTDMTDMTGTSPVACPPCPGKLTSAADWASHASPGPVASKFLNGLLCGPGKADPRIETMPAEILRKIFSHASCDDQKALRLTSRALEPHAAGLVHKRLVLSPLKRDLCVFLAVAGTPRLAGLVMELEWQEMYADAFDLGNVPGIPNCEDDIAQLQELAEQEGDSVFWLAPSKAREATTRAHLADSLAQIKSALEQMPNITAFSYRYKHPHSIIGGQYPFSAGVVHAHAQEARYVGGHCGPVATIFSHLLHAHFRLTKLVWAGHSELVDFGELFDSLPPLPTTCNLTTLHLDLESIPHPPPSLQEWSTAGVPERFGKLKTLLSSATNLRELRIQSPYGLAMEWKSNELFDMLLAGPDELTLPRLDKLQLISTPFRLAAFAAFVQRHRHTLRHVYLSECHVNTTDIAMLAHIQGIKLESLCIVEDAPNRHIPQERLLRCLHGGDLSRLTSRPCGTIATHQLVKQNGRHKLLSVDNIGTWDKLSEHGTPIVGDDDEADLESNDSQDIREAEAPCWDWLRLDGGGIYYWPVAPDRPTDKKTVCWKFTDRNGVYAYGKDPLDFFEEWDTDLGDVEEPTPYGLDILSPDSVPKRRVPEDAKKYGDEDEQAEVEWDLE